MRTNFLPTIETELVAWFANFSQKINVADVTLQV